MVTSPSQAFRSSDRYGCWQPTQMHSLQQALAMITAFATTPLRSYCYST